MRKLLCIGALSAVLPFIVFLIPHFGGDSQLISAHPSAIRLEGIEVDQSAITDVALTNMSNETFFCCGNSGRCSRTYCVFANGPVLSSPFESGATMKLQITFIPGVAGPFSEQISVYFRRATSTETVTIQVSGFAISNSE